MDYNASELEQNSDKCLFMNAGSGSEPQDSRERDAETFCNECVSTEKRDGMKTVKVKLNTIEKVKNFVGVLANYEGYFDLTSDKRVVDAKSIMGIFTMNLTKCMELRIEDTNDNIDDLMRDLRPFLVA